MRWFKRKQKPSLEMAVLTQIMKNNTDPTPAKQESVLCCDCKYYMPRHKDDEYPDCSHPLSRDIITGAFKKCHLMRRDYKPECGPEGKLFEKAPPRPIEPENPEPPPTDFGPHIATPEKDCCGNCKYWHCYYPSKVINAENTGHSIMGGCRIRSVAGPFPGRLEIDWCGEFEAKK